jgi:hypothetical protein
LISFRKVLVLAALSGAAALAQSAVVDFNGLATNDPNGSQFNDFDYGRFHFANDCGDLCFGVWSKRSSAQADPGGATVYANYGNSTTTISRTDGGTFDLQSIDFADVLNQGDVQQLVFTIQYAPGGHTVLTRWIKDRAPGLETVPLDLAGLTSISWVTAANNNPLGLGSQFDNVNYTAEAAQVPEPETYALMLGGLAVVGCAATRRRQGRAR